VGGDESGNQVGESPTQNPSSVPKAVFNDKRIREFLFTRQGQFVLSRSFDFSFSNLFVTSRDNRILKVNKSLDFWSWLLRRKGKSEREREEGKRFVCGF
jgi:hypothetical protein